MTGFGQGLHAPFFEVTTIALLAHTNCGMVNLSSKREQFIAGLIDKAGWDPEWAEAHFMHFAPMYEIGNEVDFVLSEAKRLRRRHGLLASSRSAQGAADRR